VSFAHVQIGLLPPSKRRKKKKWNALEQFEQQPTTMSRIAAMAPTLASSVRWRLATVDALHKPI